MTIKSLAATGLIVATTMLTAVGTVQAGCMNYKSGWHMVPKKCAIKPAENWQAYISGGYLHPVTGKKLF